MLNAASKRCQTMAHTLYVVSCGSLFNGCADYPAPRMSQRESQRPAGDRHASARRGGLHAAPKGDLDGAGVWLKSALPAAAAAPQYHHICVFLGHTGVLLKAMLVSADISGFCVSPAMVHTTMPAVRRPSSVVLLTQHQRETVFLLRERGPISGTLCIMQIRTFVGYPTVSEPFCSPFTTVHTCAGESVC